MAKHRRGKRAVGKCAFHGCNVDTTAYRCRKHADALNEWKRVRRAGAKGVASGV